jgi:hypothetical protein
MNKIIFISLLVSVLSAGDLFGQIRGSLEIGKYEVQCHEGCFRMIVVFDSLVIKTSYIEDSTGQIVHKDTACNKCKKCFEIFEILLYIQENLSHPDRIALSEPYSGPVNRRSQRYLRLNYHCEFTYQRKAYSSNIQVHKGRTVQAVIGELNECGTVENNVIVKCIEATWGCDYPK